MLCENQVTFLSCKRSQFVNKNGEAIQFQRVYFLPVGGDEPMDLTALNTLDFSDLPPMCDVRLTFDFYKDARSGYLRGKIVGRA